MSTLLYKILLLSTARVQLDAYYCASAAPMQLLPSFAQRRAMQPLEPKVWHGHNRKIQFSQAYKQGVRRLWKSIREKEDGDLHTS